MKLLSILIVCAVTVTNALAQTTAKTNRSLTAGFDSIFLKEFKASEPGATAIVVRKGEVIYKKAVGMADMELNVPLQTDMIFRIGSISKQFTAVAILQLAEQGKLSLQDDIKKYIPDLPYKETITIEQLLNHTSGIKSYTNKPEFEGWMRKDMKPMEIIKLTEKDTLEFKPGSDWNYNNTGYIMLGYVIEKISGKTYEEYVQQYLFAPAGMTSSLYGSEAKIIRKRAKGYKKQKDVFLNADYLSMTLPYAAGSLLSTVDDLWKWNKALYSYKLVKKEWIDKATTAHILPGGKNTRYGYGLSIVNVQGSKAIEHGGGINGFLTDAIYLPAEDVFAAVFSNCDCKSPDNTTYKLAAAAIGKPYNYKAIPVTADAAKEYEGIYVNDAGEERVIRYANGKLTSKRGSGTQFIIEMYKKDEFYFDNSLSLLAFKRNAAGSIESLDFSSNTEESNWKKTTKPLPVPQTFITVDAAVLAGYVGNYTLAPGFVLTVTHEGNQLFAQATNQPRLELLAISKTMFQTKGVDAKIEFKQNAEGKTESLVLYQGGREMPAKKE
ncbi:MAG: serine hydrolase [Chitinophagaceae bacterium]|nr:serine hydrolase [Chitinophagaceae bacterium]